MSKPSIRLFVLRAAKRLRVDPACSKTDQKSADATNRMATTISRFRSTLLQEAEVNSQTKNAATMATSSTPEASATDRAVTSPLADSTSTATARIAQAPMAKSNCLLRVAASLASLDG